MSGGRFAALLAAGVVATVASALAVTVVIERKAWREHRAHRLGRGR
jgi:hypothetical protein